jgi:2-methylisocitrate lyase-like PEP mutase family enzyme
MIHEEMINKIRTALDAREDSGFVIIARSDSRIRGTIGGSNG